MLPAKGFFWLATKHDIMGVYSQAGNCVGAEPHRPWYAALEKNQWPEDQPSLDSLASLWIEPYGDRMQEIVFIGIGMEREEIESSLNAALLTDEEYGIGPDGWQTFGDPLGAWEAEELEAELT